METLDAKFWDEWWKGRVGDPNSGTRALRCYPAPMFWDQFVNSDDRLIELMVQYGLRTVLCAGNGDSQEPRALAAAGFDVTGVDISAVAVGLARNGHYDPSNRFSRGCSPELDRPGGHVDFVVGDVLDPTVCPGPFDVIIERLMVQRFGEPQRSAVLEALSKRLGKVGIFLTHCLDDGFPPDLGWSQHESGMFHASQSWFQEHGWTIWDVAPGATLTGRVAWLIRCGSMKLPPGERGKSG